MRKTDPNPQRRSSGRRGRRFLVTLASALLLVAAALIGALPAAAESPLCGKRDKLLDSLATRHGEQPVSIGITATGALLEVLASPEGTWTIIVTVPGGPTCLVSSGEGWHNAPVQLAEEPAV